MKNKLLILDQTGHTELEYAPGSQDEHAVKDKFDELMRRNFVAFRMDGPNASQGTMIKEFDPTAEEIIMSPHFVGG